MTIRPNDRPVSSPFDRYDAGFALGSLCVAIGVGAIYWPAGLIVAGLELGFGAWIAARAKGG